jgi:hypothetical protein
MSRTSSGLLVALLMIAIIVGVDVAFLRDKPWVRLATNVGIVAAFGIGYWLTVVRN